MFPPTVYELLRRFSLVLEQHQYQLSGVQFHARKYTAGKKEKSGLDSDGDDLEDVLDAEEE